SSGAADGLLALGSDAGVAVVWDVARGEIVHELRGHTQTINDVSFCSSASGPQLITASEDRQICCWDLKSGSQLATHKTGKTAVSRLAVTSSASHVMLGSSMLKLVTCSTWKRVGYMLGLWKLQIPPESGKKKKSKKSTALQVVLSTTPDCCVRVARDPSCDDEAADKQTIFAASFCSGGEIMVAYGNEVKPTLAQVRFVKTDGTFVSTVELARASGGLFDLSKSPKVQGKKSPKQAKRPHDDVQQLGAMDMMLPSAARRKGENGDATANSSFENGAPGGEMPSFGQRLAAMESAASRSVSTNSKAKRPTTGTQVATLVQALQSGDATMLDQALAIQDTSSITSTVARLPSTAVIPLLEAVLQRVHGKPARVATLVILSSPAQAVNCKCRPHLVSALVLSGMLQSQIAAHAASGEIEGDASTDPAITYDEAEEAEVEGEEEEDDEEDDDDDDDDDEGEEEEEEEEEGEEYDDEDFGF
ncbi:MAG: hypothetical protein SGPRY_008922, partial [Prymnesium sp.]